MRPVFKNLNHNISHWLIVVFLRFLYLATIGTSGAYMTTTGFIFFKKLIEPFPPSVFFDQVCQFIFQIPYLAKIDLFLEELKFLYHPAPSWWASVVALPMMLVGANIFLINFFDFLMAIFSRSYSRTHCPFCKEPVGITNNHFI
ncbi:MAG TPA: hypothetical protein VMW29_01680 [Candidatus Bathyarchaeia archaeon]|nr:hypothetical protein [Candidatus Bathyarchaeia archaeon]